MSTYFLHDLGSDMSSSRLDLKSVDQMGDEDVESGGVTGRRDVRILEAHCECKMEDARPQESNYACRHAQVTSLESRERFLRHARPDYADANNGIGFTSALYQPNTGDSAICKTTANHNNNNHKYLPLLFIQTLLKYIVY